MFHISDKVITSSKTIFSTFKCVCSKAIEIEDMIYFLILIYIKTRKGTPVFGSLLDLVFAVSVFAVFSWNVTPANNEGRLYFKTVCLKEKYRNNKLFLPYFTVTGRYR